MEEQEFVADPSNAAQAEIWSGRTLTWCGHGSRATRLGGGPVGHEWLGTRRRPLPQMLAVARRIAADEGLDNVEFRLADVQIHPFETTRSTW